MSIVEEAIRQWEQYRAGVISELEAIAEEHWQFRPTGQSRTLRALARHIVQSAIGFTNELVRDDGSFARLFDPKVREEIQAALPRMESKEEILEALRSTGVSNARRLREAGDLAALTMTAGKSTQSRLTGLAFASSHEMYHRGQIALYARQLGLVPALTRQMEGREAP